MTSAGGCWYGVRMASKFLDNLTEKLDQEQIPYFVPKEKAVKEVAGKRVEYLKPVIHNLIFIQHDNADNRLGRKLLEMGLPFGFVKENGTQKEAQIPDSEMQQFMLMCNPEIADKKFITAEEALLKPGDEVDVRYGPLKGCTGRLVRVAKRYYLLKIVSDVGVMLKVSRWCCQKRDKEKR